MVVHFWTGRSRGLAIGALLVLLATVLFLINLTLTLRRTCRKDVAVPYLGASLSYLAARVILGNLMAVGLFIALVARSRWVSPLALLVVLGFGSAFYRVTRPWREGRPFPADWSIRHVLAASSFLTLALALGVSLAPGVFGGGALATRAAITNGFLGLVGWISLMIVGMSYRVIPLLVWVHRYSPIVHDQPVPRVGDLYSTRWQVWSFSLLVAGIVAAAGSLFVQSTTRLRVGLVLFGGGALLFEANMVWVYGHLWLSQRR